MAMNMPGFTAEASLDGARDRYHVAVTTAVIGRDAIKPALQVSDEPDWVDCNNPDLAYVCMECGARGGGTIWCCRSDYCAVIDHRFQGGGGVLAFRRAKSSPRVAATR